MSEAQPCPHCGAPIPIEGEPIEKDPDLAPVSLMASGSHDDDFPIPTYGHKLISAEPDPILGKFKPASGFLDPRTAKPKGRGVEDDLDGSGEVGWTDEVEAGDRRSPWTSVLLASYASAVTLGLAWTLIKGRNNVPIAEKVVTPPSAATAIMPEPARQAGLSRKVDPPEPIVGDHFASMGRPIQVGSLEVTPLEVKRQPVTLQHANPYAKAERREGGKGALVLRLKLKNTSNDAIFAPLDQAYVRERGKEIVDTFLLTATEERVYPFPLAVDSEWSIVGQDFGELRPGESRVVAIASAPDAPPETAGPFTWRVRLRTGINRTDLIGLRWPDKPPGPPGVRPTSK